jgi:hypothetical protein
MSNIRIEMTSNIAVIPQINDLPAKAESSAFY